ncbi:acyltransferase domain-containing protein [Streptomyces sp. ADMS]|nr:acyltransferase domain-containing protein [Streptomyces sp. ADMS]MDW4909833.1 acyltransferase domain-containing protein [Streptomyces sp. ADMS]
MAAAPSDEEAGKLLRDPVHGLPALFTVSLATARTLRSWGIEADALIGHSLGEYAAAVAAGALRLADAVTLVDVRSRGMSRTAGGGAMLTVALPEDQVVKLLGDHPELDLAAVNAPRSCVVSGPGGTVTALERRLAADSVHTARLHLDAAAHSRLVDPVLPELRAAAETTVPSVPAVPLATTLTGQLLLTPPGAEHWVPHLRSVVRFSDALTTALGTGPAVVVQVGPGSGLLQLVRQHGAANGQPFLPADEVGRLNGRQGERPLVVMGTPGGVGGPRAALRRLLPRSPGLFLSRRLPRFGGEPVRDVPSSGTVKEGREGKVSIGALADPAPQPHSGERLQPQSRQRCVRRDQVALHAEDFADTFDGAYEDVFGRDELTHPASAPWKMWTV